MAGWLNPRKERWGFRNGNEGRRMGGQAVVGTTGFLAKVVYKKEPVRNASWHQAVESAVDAVRVLSGQQAPLYQLL
jgi:hypothetical protein